MIKPYSVELERDGVRLEPLTERHRDDLLSAATDGELWRLWYTGVPAPDEVENYIVAALNGQRDGQMLPWVVRDAIV